MSEQSNIQLIHDLYAAFGRGDVAFIVSHLAPDIKWFSHLDSVIPWAGDFSGTSRVPYFFDAIFKSVDVESFEPQEWIAQGELVASAGTFGCRVRSTGKKSITRWMFLWKFKAGKVVSYEQFHAPGMAEAFK
jgi:ketosteroid isomerase-like protein